MNDIDQKIRAALQGSAEGETLAREQNLAEELLDAFRTRHRWIHGVAFVVTFLFFGVAVWAGYHCVVAVSPREQVLWGGLSLIAMMCVGFLKIYFWMEMHTNRVLRELKRVELLFIQHKK